MQASILPSLSGEDTHKRTHMYMHAFADFKYEYLCPYAFVKFPPTVFILSDWKEKQTMNQPIYFHI